MRYLRQNDPIWGKDLLGHSATTTIGRAGCLLVALNIAYNELAPGGVQDSPRTLQRHLLQKDPKTFSGSMIVLETCARILGLVCLEKERLRSVPGDPRLPDRVLAGLGIELSSFRNQTPPLTVNRTPSATTTGPKVTVGGGASTGAGSASGLCILHVDHDSKTLGGDPEGDHFIVAYAWKNGEIECADPASGKPCYLDDRTLKGESMWGSTLKRYTVVGTIPIRRT